MIARRIAHAVLVLLAALPWALGLAAFGCSLVLVLLADRIWPNATWGNCWSFAGPRWVRHGGYLVVRPADGVRVLGSGWVPHTLWMKRIGFDNEIEQTMPLRRSQSRVVPWRTLYFPYRVIRREMPHNAKDQATR